MRPPWRSMVVSCWGSLSHGLRSRSRLGPSTTKAPSWSRSGLSDKSIADANTHELFSRHVTRWFSLQVEGFLEEMGTAWALSDEDDISDEVVAALGACKRVAKVALFLRDPIIRAETLSSLAKGGKALDEAVEGHCWRPPRSSTSWAMPSRKRRCGGLVWLL